MSHHISNVVTILYFGPADSFESKNKSPKTQEVRDLLSFKLACIEDATLLKSF